MADVKGKNNPRYKTGLTMNGRSGLYKSWQNMKQRCTNPNNPKYKRYGGRGIKVCAEWQDIVGFYDWAKKSGWKQGLTIDRINNNGNYCPENCRWVSKSENSRKKRTTKIAMLEQNNQVLCNKCEEYLGELDRTRKALDVAKYALKNIQEDMKERKDGDDIWEIQKNLHDYCKTTIKQITALEQKDVK